MKKRGRRRWLRCEVVAHCQKPLVLLDCEENPEVLLRAADGAQKSKQNEPFQEQDMSSAAVKKEIPKYHRQRFIITLLQSMNSRLAWEDFQNILFVSQQETEIFYYDFVASCNGLHSFQAVSDIEVLHRLGWVEIQNNDLVLLHQLPREKGLNPAETQKLFRFIRDKKSFKEQLLFSKKKKTCEEKNNPDNESVLFTIGYEGMSVEEYINQLLRKNIRLLCDVRMNPISRKFGFSKGSLSELLPAFGIEYLHVPELGIISSSRKELHAASDYQRLFSVYKKELSRKDAFLSRVADKLEKCRRIALTCFERQPSFCHRHCISEYLEEKRGVKVIHL